LKCVFLLGEKPYFRAVDTLFWWLKGVEVPNHRSLSYFKGVYFMVANLVQPSFTAVIPTQTTHAKNALIHDKNFSDEKFSSSLIPFITQIKKTEKSVVIRNFDSF